MKNEAVIGRAYVAEDLKECYVFLVVLSIGEEAGFAASASSVMSWV